MGFTVIETEISGFLIHPIAPKENPRAAVRGFPFRLDLAVEARSRKWQVDVSRRHHR
jgi:hypothetical protein